MDQGLHVETKERLEKRRKRSFGGCGLPLSSI